MLSQLQTSWPTDGAHHIPSPASSCCLVLFRFLVFPPLITLTVDVDLLGSYGSCIVHGVFLPKAARTSWGCLSQCWSHWSPGHPQAGAGPCVIPQPVPKLLVQGSVGFWQIPAASSPFGHNLLLKTLCFMAPSSQLVFGVFVLELLHHQRPNPALSSHMCLILQAQVFLGFIAFWICLHFCILACGSGSLPVPDGAAACAGQRCPL